MNLKNVLEKILKQDESFLDIETKEINYNKVKDSADKADEKLISLILENSEIKNKFFTKIKDAFVFKTNDFKFFLDENKINNSYTQYANRIGLSDNTGLINDNTNVVLNFPFKDCVLEGGQSTEEGTDAYFEYSDKDKKYEKKESKRNEIFFNQVLAQDEIDRLFDKKALVNWKKYTKDSDDKGEDVNTIQRSDDSTIKENLIIKGNNLLALHSLKSEFTNKVKLIYIDPPYNTGNDGFKYNDTFNHSTWLTFMKNRLEIAKELLRDDGFIFVQCDDSEQAYLKVLLDSIFGRDNYRNSIYWHRTYAGKTISKNLPWNIDTILFYSKNPNSRINNITKELTDVDIASFNKDDNDGRGKYNTVSLQKTGGPGPLTTYDYIDNKGNVWKCPKKGWRMVQEKLKMLEDDNRLYITDKTLREKYYLNERLEIGKQIDNLWRDIGNMNRAKGENTGFAGQKPEKLLQRIFDLTTSTHDLILDFFAGTGTTLAVAHKTGRQYIGIEQMDYIHDLPEARLKEVVAGDQSGISKDVNWQGGGSFIYCELARWNEQAIQEINESKDLKDLEKMFDSFYEKYFLNYNVKVKMFREKIIKEENFKKLSLDEQKKMFLTMLDLNQMYVQESEMADKRFGISKQNQELTKEFYKK